MSEYTYKTIGTCSREITVELEGNIIKSVSFLGGLSGESGGYCQNRGGDGQGQGHPAVAGKPLRQQGNLLRRPADLRAGRGLRGKRGEPVMIYDSHVHTEFSADSEMKIGDALAAAKSQGYGLVLTEHYDPDYPQGMIFEFSPEDYWKAYESLRGREDDLTSGLSLGVECGLIPDHREVLQDFIARAPFDQVIGSIHLVDGQDIYEKEYYTGREKDAVFTRYFQVMADMVRDDPFIDTMGHIDYICRVAPYEDPGLEYGRYHEYIDEVLRALVETDTAMEINTRRFGDKSVLAELEPVYRRYRQLGGKLVTVGSDAHTPDRVGKNIRLALDFAESLELTPVTFRNRKAVILC